MLICGDILPSLQQNANIFDPLLKKKSLEVAKEAAAASHRGKSEEYNYGNDRSCKGNNQIQTKLKSQQNMTSDTHTDQF